MESPPKPQPNKKPKTVSCFVCNASHPLEKCNKLLNMPLEKRTEILRKDRRCFRCLEKENHIAKFCQSEGFKCANTDCGFNHPTILCGLRKLMQEKQKEKIAAQNTNGNQRPPRPTGNNGNERLNHTNAGASTSNGGTTSSGTSTSNGASTATSDTSNKTTHNVNSI